MSNFKILLPFLFSTIISLTFSSYSSDSYAANVTDKHCLKPQSMVARESASSEKMLIIKRYRASSGDIACFGNELKLSVLSFKDQIANISVKKRGEKRKTFSMSANSTIHLQGLNIKLYSSGHSQTFTLRLSLKASPTDAFPGETVPPQLETNIWSFL